MSTCTCTHALRYVPVIFFTCCQIYCPAMTTTDKRQEARDKRHIFPATEEISQLVYLFDVRSAHTTRISELERFLDFKAERAAMTTTMDEPVQNNPSISILQQYHRYQYTSTKVSFYHVYSYRYQVPVYISCVDACPLASPGGTPAPNARGARPVPKEYVRVGLLNRQFCALFKGDNVTSLQEPKVLVHNSLLRKPISFLWRRWISRDVVIGILCGADDRWRKSKLRRL